MIPAEAVGWMRDGEKLLTRTIEAAATSPEPDPLMAPSLLPDWHRAAVVAHVAGNAEGLVNLLRWAATGVPTPMYASAQAREDAIAQWGSADVPALLEHARQTRQALDHAIDAMDDSSWDRPVQTNSGRTVEARVIPWMRVREVFIHAVDLDAGTAFDDIPADVRCALIGDVVASLSAKPKCPVLRLGAGQRHWRLGVAAGQQTDAGWTASSDAGGAAPDVEGSESALLAWLIGRSDGRALSSAAPLPDLPRWL